MYMKETLEHYDDWLSHAMRDEKRLKLKRNEKFCDLENFEKFPGKEVFKAFIFYFILQN